MIFVFSFLLGLCFTVDLKNLPNPCVNEMQTLCTINTVESMISDIESSVVTNGEENTWTAIENGNFDTSNFWPWLVQSPDTTLYDYSRLVPLNGEVLSTAHQSIETALANGEDYTSITLGTESTGFVQYVARSSQLTDDISVSVIYEDFTPDLILCDGTYDAPCNGWMAAKILGEVKYDILTSAGIQNSYSLDNIEVTVVTQNGTVVSGSGPTDWLDSAEDSDYQDLVGADYAGWLVTIGEYRVAVTHGLAAVDVLPASSDTLDSLSTCNPSRVSGCSLNMLATIVDSITSDAGSVGKTELLAKFDNGDYDTQGWSIQLRDTTTGTLVKTSTSTMAIASDISIHTVASIALEGGNGGWVEYMSDFGPYKTYVVPILGEYYLQSGFINSDTSGPTAFPTSIGDEDDGSDAPILTILLLVWSIFMVY